MDPDVSRDYLATLLTEEADVLAQLEVLLQREHEVLGAQDMTAMEAAARLRQERIGALAHIEEQRRSLCSMHGHSDDKAGLDRLMSWCDPQGSLVSRVRECAQRVRRCRDLNDRNGILVTARLKHVENRLAVLTGRSTSAITYGPPGPAARQFPKRVLGAA